MVLGIWGLGFRVLGIWGFGVFGVLGMLWFRGKETLRRP